MLSDQDILARQAELESERAIEEGAWRDIAHIIQLAIAPVFMLSTVCTNLLVLLNRLARIIDRSRVLEERLDVAYNDTYINELDVLYRRSHLINVAIALCTACGLFSCGGRVI